MTLYDHSPQSDVGFEIRPHAEPRLWSRASPINLDKLAGQSFLSFVSFSAPRQDHTVLPGLSFFFCWPVSPSNKQTGASHWPPQYTTAFYSPSPPPLSSENTRRLLLVLRIQGQQGWVGSGPSAQWMQRKREKHGRLFS